MSYEPKYLWHILVPTLMANVNNDIRPIKTRYHQQWDEKVKEITGGLTIFRPAIGYWVSPDKETFNERMIPVGVYCTESQINAIADIAAKHYKQKAMMFYVVSEKVTIKNYDN